MSTPLTRPPATVSPGSPGEIDIYDPNLTPAQVASLSPSDRELRRLFASGEDDDTPGVDSTGGEIIVSRNRIPTESSNASTEAQSLDWRLKVSLAPGANYLYKSDRSGILAPLNETNGVIFPYTPSISTSYIANYSNYEPTHSNYKFHQYSNSSVEAISVTGRFTAQDETEARYLLAVIHFFRTATKMFYGQDQNPNRGTPPPVLYMNGYGDYQFSNHQVVVNSFSYNMPTEVDYIPTKSIDLPPGQPARGGQPASLLRMGSNITAGGRTPEPQFSASAKNDGITWVPTKVDLVVQFLPIVTRNDMSNRFSVQGYASGELINGRKTGRGFW